MWALTPFDTSAHTIWCERSHQMVWDDFLGVPQTFAEVLRCAVSHVFSWIVRSLLLYGKIFLGASGSQVIMSDVPRIFHATIGEWHRSEREGWRWKCWNSHSVVRVCARKNAWKIKCRQWSRLNFSDEDLIWRLSSSTFNLHLSSWLRPCVTLSHPIGSISSLACSARCFFNINGRQSH